MWTRKYLVNAILETEFLKRANRSMEERGTKGLFTKEAKEHGYSDVQAYARDVLDNKVSGNKKRAAFAKAMGTIARRHKN